MSKHGDEMTRAERAKYEADYAKLQAALNGPRGSDVAAALDDFVDFPPKSGTIEE